MAEEIADWETWRDWGHSAYDSAADGTNTLQAEADAGGTDWGKISMDYQNATGKDWVTGEALSTPESTATSSASVTATPSWDSYVTDDMDMATQMEKYSGKDSPLMVAAETAALREQNSRGLLNTQGTLSAIQNNQWSAAQEQATADVDRATSVALARMDNDMQKYIADSGITASNQQTMSSIWGNLVDTQLATMGAGINDGSWSQVSQTNMENVINAAGSALSGFLSVPLT